MEFQHSHAPHVPVVWCTWENLEALRASGYGYDINGKTYLYINGLTFWVDDEKYFHHYELCVNLYAPSWGGRWAHFRYNLYDWCFWFKLRLIMTCVVWGQAHWRIPKEGEFPGLPPTWSDIYVVAALKKFGNQIAVGFVRVWRVCRENLTRLD